MRGLRRLFAGNLVIGLMAGAMALAPVAAPASAADMASPRLKPPAPAPQFASRMDIERLKSIKSALDRKQFSTARAVADAVEGPIAKSLGRWYYFYAEDPGASFADIAAFLDDHPDWPALVKIQVHAEELMPETMSAQGVLAFFDRRDPATAGGKMHLARALLANGDRDAAALHLRDAWVNDSFSLADEQRFMARYSGYVTSDDHAARIDRLLFARQVSTAQRYFARLQSAERRRAEVRASLLLGAKGADLAFDRLPDEDRMDPGVLLAAVRYFRRAEQEPRAIMLARTAPSDPALMRNSTRWWEETNLLMRWALKNNLYADAYAMAAGHGLEAGSTEFSEAEFNAGWIALRYLGDAARARTHFAALTASVGSPISLSRGHYWLARAEEALGDEAAAGRRYAAAAQHIYSYYGQLAAEKIGGAPAAAKFVESPAATAEDKARFASRPVAQALRILTETGDERAFLIFSYSLDDQLETRGEFLELAALANRLAATHVIVRAGKVAVRADAFAPEVAYPVIFVPDDATRFAPAEIILGLSRQESEFNPRAYSRAGARGLMQLLPSTAQITARKERIPYSRAGLLDDPIYNMTIGAAHLSHLLTDFNGSYVMTLAAYNAGPHRVKQWVEAYGDPRSPVIDPVDWVEQIPFSETRNYVQRVLENTQVYRARITGETIAGRLAGDIERGGARGRVAARPAIKGPGALPPVQERIAAIAAPVLAPPAPPPSLAPEREAAAEPVVEPAVKPARTDRRRRAKPAPTTQATPIAADAPLDASADETPPAFAPATEREDYFEKEGLIEAPVDGLEDTPIDSEAIPASQIDDDPVAAAPGADGAAIAVAADASVRDCDAYVAFLAEAGGEEATAADLNAGALARLEAPVPGC